MWPKRNKEKERFYLLAGMGGRSLRRKRRIFLAWAVAAGSVVSILVGIALYYVNNRH
ncbi:MAG: hypothetical protein JWQ04_980 [Pedosphaera sp.]|nr:hypothetical protein [Pedosphaera sp.]